MFLSAALLNNVGLNVFVVEKLRLILLYLTLL
jgi:hypothetical protein